MSILMRRLLIGGLVAGAAAALVGIPTGIIETPFYTRMTPVLWWNYPVWAASSLLTGALVATYARDPSSVPAPAGGTGKPLLGNLLSLFAVGCPICNKLVVMVLGVSGAMTWFSPAQPVLAAASVGLLAYAIRARVRTMRACSLPSS